MITIPECLRDSWMCWELWTAERATMTELQTTLSIDDVDMMTIALRAVADARPAPEEG